MEADHPRRQGPRAEPDSVPLLVPAGGGVRAADELGFYFQVEARRWANQSTTLGDGKPVDQWLYDETDRILKAYGNHPSFLLMPYGNEPGGKNANAYLAKWVDHYKAQDPRRLYTSGAGWPQLPENQFHVTPDPRIQALGRRARSPASTPGRRRRAPTTATTSPTRKVPGHQPRDRPVVRLSELRRDPEIHRLPQAARTSRSSATRSTRTAWATRRAQFLLASGKLQTLCYKEDIESALRTPGMGGFQLLDLHDFPGQGTALVGVLDPFWEDKGYVTAEEYSRFCNRTVPLARLSKRVFTTDETLEADIEVAHFGPAPLANAVRGMEARGRRRQGRRRAANCLPQTIPVDNGIALGSVQH